MLQASVRLGWLVAVLAGAGAGADEAGVYPEQYPPPGPAYLPPGPAYPRHPSHNCTVVDEVLQAEICRPSFTTACSPTTVRGSKLGEVEQCVPVTRTVCSQASREQVSCTTPPAHNINPACR